MKHKRFVIALVALLALLLTTGGATGQGPSSEGDAHPQGDVSVAGTVGSRISYQGRLTEGGIPVTGSRDMRFRLFTDSSCTSEVGEELVKDDVTVTEGLFSVELDASQWEISGQGIWLEVEVGPEIFGCQEILPVPYALSLRPGATIEDTGSIITLNRYHYQPLTLDSYKYGIEAEVDGSYNGTYGVHGVAGNTKIGGAAYGLHGSATAANGTAIGVYGTAPETGVEGRATATEGATSGVYGQTSSLYFDAAGVYGEGGYYGVRGIGQAYGVYGEASASGTSGVRGYHGGSGDGVSGQSSAAGNAGVYGRNTGAGRGLYGNSVSGAGAYAESDSGVGVHAVSGSDTALWAQTAGGLAGVHAQNTGTGHGVLAESAGPGLGGTAVYAQANHPDGVALYGGSDSTDATLVLRNDGMGDLVRGFSHGDWTLRFRVENDGRTSIPVLEITGGSDLSEQFDVTAADGEVAPGLVVCIDANQPGKLRVCDEVYDRTVAGVVSGAGGIEPGMVMGQHGSPADGAFPVALTGRVYAWADASEGPIQPGDLLTTSDAPGHVMAVSDYERAQGAVIGKAMSSLDSGQGLILVLISLQ